MFMTKLKRTVATLLALTVPCQLLGAAEQPPASKSALGALAEKMPVGTWAELLSKNIDPVLSNGAGGPGHNILPYCGSLPWDPINKKIKGNMESHGQPARQVEYDDATNTWSIVSKNPPAGSTHGFDHNTVNPHTGEHHAAQVGPKGKGGFWRHREGKWELKTIPGNDLSQAIAIGSCWWAGSLDGFGKQGGWMAMNGAFGTLLAYDPLADKWPIVKGGYMPGVTGVYDNLMEYSARKNCAVYGGGNNFKGVDNLKLWRLNADHSFTAMPESPRPIGVSRGFQFSDEPVTGNFLACGFGELWELNPDDKGAWTKQTGARVPPADLVIIPNNSTGARNTAVVSCSTYGVNIYLEAKVGGRTPMTRMWVYKHATKPDKRD